MSKFYLTTPLYYVNASAHIGHAYTNIICDCIARFHRLQEKEVFFLTGTDEHGEKIKKAAQDNKKEVKEFVDEVVKNFLSLWEELNISYDMFIRTTQDFHIQTVQKVILTLFAKGDIYKASYQGFYCIPCESFWAESQIKENGGCPSCGREVEEIVEENYFFRISRYEQWLRGYLKSNPGFIKPKIRYNEAVGFLENNPLVDLCISRPKKRVFWGIDFPVDNSYVVYVWFDALLNYISAVGYGYDEGKFEKWWPADVQVIGKDILRHHVIFWPIMLKALDLPLPHRIFAHGWWKVGEEKMSKSKGNIVDPYQLVTRIGVDALRYFLLREIPVGMDGNFSWNSIVNRINSDLANDLGNLVYRTLTMAEKYFQGRISPSSYDIPSEFSPLIEEIDNSYVSCMENLEFNTVLEKVWRFINAMNKFIEDSKPWELWKAKSLEQLNWFLFSLLEGIRIISIWVYPFMPQVTKSIYRQVCLPIEDEITIRNVLWRKDSFVIRKEKPLFPRIDAD